MSQVSTLLSWMNTFGSATTPIRSLTTSPVVSPVWPQWYGIQIWCTTRPSTRSGAIRSVITTRASTAVRLVMT